MSDPDFKYMVEAVATDLAEMLANDLGLSVCEALDVLYNSDTYVKLTDRSTGLYFQSSKYIYSYLQNELATGKLS